MLRAISRYGARVIPNTQQLAAELEGRGQLVQGPHIAQFEDAFARRLGVNDCVTTSYGRMAFYYLLQSLELPPGSEAIVPALTFWVVPEMARVAGLTPVFADVDPNTFTLSPRAFEQAITERTRVVVPTHLWGLPCDMDPILEIASRHGITVIEDCAHALGATYRGRPVGTLGDAAFFSLQTLKPLNTYGGGVAVTGDAAVGARVRTRAEAEPWPDEKDVRWNLFRGRVQRISTRPDTFTWTLFPMAWLASHLGVDASRYLWERVRPLDPLPQDYSLRYANVQAAIGLEALAQLDAWTARTRAHAARMDGVFARFSNIATPAVPPDRTHVYYQYCVYVPDRDRVARDCIRRGVDVETLHVDVCTQLDLFGPPRPSPGADRSAHALQLPVYESLTDDQVGRVAQVLADSVSAMTPTRVPQIPQSQS